MSFKAQALKIAADLDHGNESYEAPNPYAVNPAHNGFPNHPSRYFYSNNFSFLYHLQPTSVKKS